MKFRDLFIINSGWKYETILTITGDYITDECEAIEAIEAVDKYGDAKVLCFNNELVILASF